MDTASLQEFDCYCPYCGEPVSLLLNAEEVGLQYIEDCHVCCRPIEIIVTEDGWGNLGASVATDTD